MGRAGEGQGLHFGHVDFEMTLRNSKDDSPACDWAKGPRMGLAWRCMSAEITHRRSREGREFRGHLEKDQHLIVA